MTHDAGDTSIVDAEVATIADTGTDNSDRLEPMDVVRDDGIDALPEDATDAEPDVAIDTVDADDAGDADDGSDVTEDDAMIAIDADDAFDATVEIDADDAIDAPEPIDVVDAEDIVDAPAATCVHAIAGMLPVPGTYDGVLTGTGTNATTRCLSRTSGPEDVLALHIDARTGIVISADDTRTMVDTVLAIRRACDDVATEIACNDDDGSVRATASILRTVLDPGDYYLVVDTASTMGGAYHLDVTTFAPVAGSDCASAIVMTPGTATAADTAVPGMQSLSCRVTYDGGQTFFAIDVPPMTRVSVSSASGIMPGAVMLRALDACDPAFCFDNDYADVSLGQVQFANEGTSTRRFYVTASMSSTSRSSLAFQLIATFSPTATNATCTSAAPLTPAMPLTAQDTGRGGNPSTLCDPAADGGQLYYSLTIPPGTRADVTAAIASTGILVIRELESCTTRCLAYTQGSLNMNVTHTIYNEGPAARDVLLSVSGSVSTTPVTFDLSVAFVTLLPNAYCPAATTFSPTSPITGQNTALGGPTDTRCLPNRGPEVYYAIDVPARTGAAITVQPSTTSQRVSVRAFDACDATACLTSGASPGTGSNVVVVWVYNLGSTAHTYYVGVSASATGTTTTFGISASFTSLSANADCTMPAPIAVGTMLTAQDTSVGGAPDTHCNAPPGASLYYALTLPPASRASVVVTPTASTDRVNARVFDSCASTFCSDFSSSPTDGAAVTVLADNPSGAARTVLVAVSSARIAPISFSLAVSSAAIPYRYDTFTGVCDDLSSTAPLGGLTTGDAVAPNAPLPFTFRFFGVDEGFRTVSANGFLQLFTASSGLGTAAAINLPIPTNGNPNAVIAPFWDDLDLVAGETTDVRVATFGSSPDRHVTFEWNNWTLRAAPSVRLRFQARLFETSNQIEFVYCDIVPGTDASMSSGGSASVGLENGAGNDGVTYSFNTAGTVRTDAAVRWVPLP